MFVPLALALLWTLKASSRVGGVSVMLTASTGVAFILILYWTAMRIPATYYNFNVIVPTLSLAVVAMSQTISEALYFRRALALS
ncbi:MAG: hypothetical protein ACRD3W_00865, partial [Terriglobales bacterium]